MAEGIAAQLKTLMALQAVDAELYALRRQCQAGPVKIEQGKAVYDADAKRVRDLEGQLKVIQVRRGTMEGDLAAKEANVRKFQMQMYQVKTNKEYTVLQHEIEGLKADNSVLEEEILKLMEEADQRKADVVAAQKALKEERDRLQAEAAAIECQVAQWEAAISRLSRERAELAPRVDPMILARYERILEKKDGVAFVPLHVVQEACGGCHMNVPPQAINEIRMKERLVTCESCARILYYPDDHAAA